MLGDIQISIEIIFLDWRMFSGIFRFLQIWYLETKGMLGDIQIFIEMIFLDWGMFRGIFRFL